MQDWRFDELTRTLGKATSRRQVLKGLVGGVVAGLVRTTMSDSVAASGSRGPDWGSATGNGGGSAAAIGCTDQRGCEKQAAEHYAGCYQDCVQRLNSCMGDGGARAIPCILDWRSCSSDCNQSFHDDRQSCHDTGCVSGETCCGDQCVNLYGDNANCGACGHACSSVEECLDATCECTHGKVCNEQCVDTQTDPNNCGDCGHGCGTCEDCVTGQCVPISCGDGQICCHDKCVSLCLNGDQPDPTTCQCNICKGQMNGAACDANNSSMACCNEQCVSTQCPTAKEYGFDTCSCQCTSSCPPGQLQDPDTCACQNLCEGVACDECFTCDPTSGDCVMTDLNSSCSTGVCCKGQCVDACSGGVSLNPDTCQCQCPSITCSAGQVQDPSTCQCVPACESGLVCQPSSQYRCCYDDLGDWYCCYASQTCTPNCHGTICCSG